MSVFSHYGIGIKIHAIEKRPNGRVEFTLWFTIFFIPIFPVSSWSAVYSGEFHDAICEDGHSFTDLVRIDRDFLYYLQTFTRSLIVLAIAIAPCWYIIHRTSGRAATTLEMLFVYASAAWPVVIVFLIERHRRKLLRGKWS